MKWEFRRNYPEGIEKKRSLQIEIEQKITAEIDKLIDEAPSRKLKKKYKFLRKVSRSQILFKQEIMQIGEDYSDLMDSFGKPPISFKQCRIEIS